MSHLFALQFRRELPRKYPKYSAADSSTHRTMDTIRRPMNEHDGSTNSGFKRSSAHSDGFSDFDIIGDFPELSDDEFDLIEVSIYFQCNS